MCWTSCSIASIMPLFVLDRLTDGVHKRGLIGRAMCLDDRARNADEGRTAYCILIEQRAEIIHALLAGQMQADFSVPRFAVKTCRWPLP